MRTAVQDGMGRILTLTLPVGSSIGLHTHEGNCEIIHVLSGSGVCHDDGQDVALRAGMTHYCRRGTATASTTTARNRWCCWRCCRSCGKRDARRPAERRTPFFLRQDGKRNGQEMQFRA